MRSKKVGGDLAEFGKKRNTDYDFPPHYMWAEMNKNLLFKIGDKDIERNYLRENEKLKRGNIIYIFQCVLIV